MNAGGGVRIKEFRNFEESLKNLGNFEEELGLGIWEFNEFKEFTGFRDFLKTNTDYTKFIPSNIVTRNNYN